MQQRVLMTRDCEAVVSTRGMMPLLSKSSKLEIDAVDSQ